jgi:hypothetical protein
MTSSSKSATPMQSGDGQTKSKSLRKRLGLSKKKDDKRDDQITQIKDEVVDVSSSRSLSASGGGVGDDRSSSRSSRKRVEDSNSNTNGDGTTSEKSGTGSTKRPSRGSRMAEGVMKRVRSLSRSRSSRGRASDTDSSSDSEHHRAQKTIVTVTSCRSDGYYNQKAPGSTSKLPRKAPTNLKLFHELAVGLKDAYAAIGQTPVKPETLEGEMSEKEFHGRTVLWEFIGNIDFVRI